MLGSVMPNDSEWVSVRHCDMIDAAGAGTCTAGGVVVPKNPNSPATAAIMAPIFMYYFATLSASSSFTERSFETPS